MVTPRHIAARRGAGPGIQYMMISDTIHFHVPLIISRSGYTVPAIQRQHSYTPCEGSSGSVTAICQVPPSGLFP